MKKAIIGVLVIIIILISSFLIYRKIDIEQNTKRIGTIKNEVITYINKENGCNENMYDLKVEYYFQRRLLGYNPYVIKATFNDEQNVIYYYDYTNGRISEQSVSPMNGKEDKNFKHLISDDRKVNTPPKFHKTLNSRTIDEKEIKIDNKPIIQLKYADLIKLWGKPNEIKKVKAYFPATVEPDYSYILKYDGIDIEMYPVGINVSVEDTESFRFDITSSKYDFYGVKIGTSLSDYLKTVENKAVYSIKEIYHDTTGERIPYEYRKLLTQVKESNYYNEYEKAVYEQVILNDMSYGAVILFKDDKISRIVYGYPNAS